MRENHFKSLYFFKKKQQRKNCQNISQANHVLKCLLVKLIQNIIIRIASFTHYLSIFNVYANQKQNCVRISVEKIRVYFIRISYFIRTHCLIEVGMKIQFDP